MRISSSLVDRRVERERKLHAKLNVHTNNLCLLNCTLFCNAFEVRVKRYRDSCIDARNASKSDRLVGRGKFVHSIIANCSQGKLDKFASIN